MTFSEQAWQATLPIYQKTITHPFVVALGNGTLDARRFGYYIAQDALYLPEYSRAMALAAAKCHNEADRVFFLTCSREALCGETELHRHYAQTIALPPAHDMAPACFAYTAWLQALGARESLAVIAAALLPCAWIYAEVGLALTRVVQDDNPWKRWINTYADPAFMQTATALRALCDREAEEASETGRSAMHAAYTMGARLEYAFWDDAWRLAEWPA